MRKEVDNRQLKTSFSFSGFPSPPSIFLGIGPTCFCSKFHTNEIPFAINLHFLWDFASFWSIGRPLPRYNPSFPSCSIASGPLPSHCVTFPDQVPRFSVESSKYILAKTPRMKCSMRTAKLVFFSNAPSCQSPSDELFLTFMNSTFL